MRGEVKQIGRQEKSKANAEERVNGRERERQKTT